MTLTEFLLARIAEDEAEVAEWPTEGKWGRYDAETMWMDPTGRPIYAPRARVLAECEAKRRIVGRYVDTTYIEPTPSNAYDLALFHVMCDLALPYADHPDYDEEWKP